MHKQNPLKVQGAKFSTLLRFIDYFISFYISIHSLSAENGIQAEKEIEYPLYSHTNVLVDNVTLLLSQQEHLALNRLLHHRLSLPAKFCPYTVSPYNKNDEMLLSIFILKYNVTFYLACGVEFLTDVTFMDFVDLCLASCNVKVVAVSKCYEPSCGIFGLTNLLWAIGLTCRYRQRPTIPYRSHFIPSL